MKILGIAIALLLLGCNGSDDNDRSETSGSDLADAEAFKTDSPYAATIGDCIRASGNNEYCELAQLPLLGMGTPSPSVDDVLERLVVSHAWMGQRFEQLLLRYPAQILYLFRGITAVVIDDDIRPAYYSPATGAIYLDPAYLWLSNAEKATINQKQDFRSGFSDPLDFRAVGRYMNGNEPAFRFYSLSGSEERRIEDIEFAFARLLLHELAHANDFFPPDRYANVDSRDTPQAAANKLQSESISSRLYSDDGLISQRLFSLAEVMYLGRDPSSEDLSTTAAIAGSEFAADAASDDYAYTTRYEDVAMLFEATMMKYFWDLDYDVGFIEVPTGSCIDAPVITAWAQRTRIGEPRVKQRAKRVSDTLLSEVDMNQFYENLEHAKDFTPGSNWCEPAAFSDEPASSTLQKTPLRRYSQPLETFRPYL